MILSDDLSSLIPDPLPQEAGPVNDAADNTGTAAGTPPSPTIQTKLNLFFKFQCWLKRRFQRFRITIRISLTAILLAIFCPRDYTVKPPPKFNGIRLIAGNNTFPVSAFLAGGNNDQILAWDSLINMLSPEIRNHPGNMIFTVGPGRDILKIRLKDSTLISLAPASRLELSPSFGERTRHIKLQGEATFQVSPHRDKVLTIQCGPMQIATSSALINVSAYPLEDYQASLVSGSIYVRAGRQTAMPDTGYAAVLVPATGEMYTKSIDRESVLSWQKNGCCMFTGRMLKDVLSQLERWYSVPIVVENSRTSHYSYSGCIYKSNSLKEVLESLRRTDNIEFKFDKDGVIHVWRKE